MANVHGHGMQENLYRLEKTFPDILDIRIIQLEFTSAKGCNVDVPISASLSSLHDQWRQIGTVLINLFCFKCLLKNAKTGILQSVYFSFLATRGWSDKPCPGCKDLGSHMLINWPLRWHKKHLLLLQTWQLFITNRRGHVFSTSLGMPFLPAYSQVIVRQISLFTSRAKQGLETAIIDFLQGTSTTWKMLFCTLISA